MKAFIGRSFVKKHRFLLDIGKICVSFEADGYRLDGQTDARQEKLKNSVSLGCRGKKQQIVGIWLSNLTENEGNTCLERRRMAVALSKHSFVPIRTNKKHSPQAQDVHVDLFRKYLPRIADAKHGPAMGSVQQEPCIGDCGLRYTT